MEQTAVLKENMTITINDEKMRGNALFRKLIHTLSGLISHSPKLFPKESVPTHHLITGSLAVEAALVLPIFLYSLLCLMSVLVLMRQSLHIQQVLFEEGLYLSETAYETARISEAEAAMEMNGKLGTNMPPIDYSLSNLSDPEQIRLTSSYEGKIPFDYFDLFHKSFTQGVWIHSFTGYVHGLNSTAGSFKEEHVYVTEGSEVYHRSLNCSHIHLLITGVSASEIKTMRNQYGDKYTACSHCHAKLTDANLYITPEGDCYHNTLECSGLKRTVYTIPLSQVGDRRPCSRCGY